MLICSFGWLDGAEQIMLLIYSSWSFADFVHFLHSNAIVNLFVWGVLGHPNDIVVLFGGGLSEAVE